MRVMPSDMENFVYYNPVKVVFGSGSLKEVGANVAAYGKKALLVSYANPTFLAKTIAVIHEELIKCNVSCVDYFAVTANPLLSQARQGVSLCLDNEIDIVIGLGGGSVMDCAKIIAAGALYGNDIGGMIMFSHSNVKSVSPKRALPTVMIPTIPATGSEMNPTAVITDDQTKQKSYVWEPKCFYPKVAILDPDLTLSLPPYQTACGAYDIIAHVAESYLNGNPDYDLEVTDRLQEGIIKATMDSLAKVWDNPADIQARGNLMWEASIALNGWLTSGTFGFTPMHQLGHVLSAQYNATHGATLACMMPAWMRYFAKRPDNGRYMMFAERIFGCGIEQAADIFEEQMRRHGVQTRMHELGVKQEDIEFLADQVVSVSFGSDGKLNGNPQTTREDIVQIYKLAF